MTEKVTLREVGMRDGLQSLPPVLTTEQKNAWCAAEFAAGVKEIEVTSFVPPKLLPMFADAEDVVRQALTLDGLTVSALIPNLRGAERGVALGVPSSLMCSRSARATIRTTCGAPPPSRSPTSNA